jgi:cyanophycinase
MVASETRENLPQEQNDIVPEVKGQLVIIGGAEDRDGECKILREFVRLSGGRQARIGIMTAATSYPGEVGDEYRAIFERLGAIEAVHIDTPRREDAEDRNMLALLEDLTGVFFTGGDQRRIMETIKDTPMDKVLRQKLNRGLVIGGTSAGASIMSDFMIAEGDGDAHAHPDSVIVESGMGFIQNVIIDQHFSARGRVGRLLSAIVEQPVVLGIGIDENTAIAVNGNEFEVIGENTVTILDVADVTYSNIDKSLPDDPLTICNVKMHILAPGYKYDLSQRKALCEINK